MIRYSTTLFCFSLLFFSAFTQTQKSFSVDHNNFQKEYFKESTFDLSDHLQILKDESGKQTLAQVQQTEFTPNPERIDLNANDVYWIKLKVQGSTQKDSTFLFRIGKGLLSCKHAEIYVDGKSQLTGSDIPIAQKPLEAHANYFTIFLEKNELIKKKSVYIFFVLFF